MNSNTEIYDKESRKYFYKKDYSERLDRWDYLVKRIEINNLVENLRYELQTSNRLTQDQKLVLAAIDAGSDRRRWCRHASSYRDKLDEISVIKNDLKLQREENKKLRDMIQDASNKSGLFIKYVRDKLNLN